MNASNTLTRPKTFRVKPLGDIDGCSTVRLDISVGRKYHEGARLEAAVKWAKENFQNVVICVGDTLQRHNKIIDCVDPVTAYNEALVAGDTWLDRNADIIKGCTILRWEDVMAHPAFSEIHSRVVSLYQASSIFHDQIVAAIHPVMLRRDIPEVERPRFRALSAQYLLEEIAGMAIENRLHPGLSAYPGDLPSLWKMVDGLPEFSRSRCVELRIYKK